MLKPPAFPGYSSFICDSKAKNFDIYRIEINEIIVYPDFRFPVLGCNCALRFLYVSSLHFFLSHLVVVCPLVFWRILNINSLQKFPRNYSCFRSLLGVYLHGAFTAIRRWFVGLFAAVRSSCCIHLIPVLRVMSQQKGLRPVHDTNMERHSRECLDLAWLVSGCYNEWLVKSDEVKVLIWIEAKDLKIGTSSD